MDAGDSEDGEGRGDYNILFVQPTVKPAHELPALRQLQLHLQQQDQGGEFAPQQAHRLPKREAHVLEGGLRGPDQPGPASQPGLRGGPGGRTAALLDQRRRGDG